MAPSQRRANFQTEFLICPLCLEDYDKANHLPKGLPCLHSFCVTCLHKHASGRSEFKCPTCSHQILLPKPGNVSSLPTNFNVEKLQDFQDMFADMFLTKLECGNCSDGNQAVKHCNSCGCDLCQVCVDAHARMKSLCHHVVTELNQSRTSMQPQQKQQAISFEHCNLVLTQESAKNQKDHIAVLYTADSQGHTLPYGGADVKVTQLWDDGRKAGRKDRCNVQDNNDSTYTITYKPRKEKVPSHLIITIDGTTFQNGCNKRHGGFDAPFPVTKDFMVRYRYQDQLESEKLAREKRENRKKQSSEGGCKQ